MTRTVPSIRMTVSLPEDVAAYLSKAANERFSSRNTEVVRAIREAMATEAAGLSPRKQDPAAQFPADAQTSASSTNG